MSRRPSPERRQQALAGATGAGSALRGAWRSLVAEQRLAVGAAGALWVTMLLPWYSKSVVGVSDGRPAQARQSLNAFQAFSWVEAAVLLVSVGIIAMLIARGRGRAFHLPGGDGTVVLAAGAWVCLLIFYRQFDKPNADSTPTLSTNVGVSWGIFVAFVAGLVLAYAGTRLRAAQLTEPALPGDPDPAGSDPQAPDPEPRPSPSAAAPARRPWSEEPARPERFAPLPPAADERPRPERDQQHTVVDPRDQTTATRIAGRPPPTLPPAREQTSELDVVPEFDPDARRKPRDHDGS